MPNSSKVLKYQMKQSLFFVIYFGQICLFLTPCRCQKSTNWTRVVRKFKKLFLWLKILSRFNIYSFIPLTNEISIKNQKPNFEKSLIICEFGSVILPKCQCNKAYNLSIQFPEPIEDFDARIHLEKLMACVYDGSKEVVQVKDFEEISEVWGCEIKVPEEAAMVIVVMVFKNGSKQALLNYKLK